MESQALRALFVSTTTPGSFSEAEER